MREHRKTFKDVLLVVVFYDRGRQYLKKTLHHEKYVVRMQICLNNEGPIILNETECLFEKGVCFLLPRSWWLEK